MNEFGEQDLPRSLPACQLSSSSPARSPAGRHPQHPEAKEAFSETRPGHGLCPDQVKRAPPPGAPPCLASEHKVTQRFLLLLRLQISAVVQVVQSPQHAAARRQVRVSQRGDGGGGQSDGDL